MAKDDPRKMELMHNWLEAVTRELELDPELMDRVESPLLRLISKVAHGPSRPGAPLSAFLVGYAAASGGGDPVDYVNRVTALVERYPVDD